MRTPRDPLDHMALIAVAVFLIAVAIVVGLALLFDFPPGGYE